LFDEKEILFRVSVMMLKLFQQFSRFLGFGNLYLDEFEEKYLNDPRLKFEQE